MITSPARRWDVAHPKTMLPNFADDESLGSLQSCDTTLQAPTDSSPAAGTGQEHVRPAIMT